MDVTRKTHQECVKLIKKTGDTLALKVYTPRVPHQSEPPPPPPATQAASGVYQSPASFYAASNLNMNSLPPSKTRRKTPIF